MFPAVTFRRPDNFFAIVNVMPVFPSRRETWAEVAVIEKSLGSLGDQGTRFAGLRVDVDDGVGLVTTLVVLEGEAATVLPPYRCADGVGVREQLVINLRLLFGCNIEQDREGDVQSIARLVVVNGAVLRLDLVSRRRLDIHDLSVVTRPGVVGHQLFGVRRPCECTQRIEVVLRTVETDWVGRVIAFRLYEHVEILDECFVLAIEGRANSNGLRRELVHDPRADSRTSGTCLRWRLL